MKTVSLEDIVVENNMVNKWKKLERNVILNRRGYYISYNPDTNSTEEGMMLNLLGNVLGGLDRTGAPETALCKNGDFKILHGDFRKQYEKCKSYTACVAFFKKNAKKHGSDWTTGGIEQYKK